MATPLFLLSSGRSGSTLLQRVLNTYQNVTVWGEHGGFLAPLADSYFRLLENPGCREFIFPVTVGRPVGSPEQLAERKNPCEWQAWTNFFTPDEVTAFFRRHVESFFRHPLMDDRHVWGFKEIRYGRNDRVIEFLHELFPDAIFVFLCRHALSTLASQARSFHGLSGVGRLWPTRRLLDACRAWKLQNQTLSRWHASGKIRSYWISYEELCQGGAELAPLVEALGLRLGPAQEAVFQLEDGRGSAFTDAAGAADRWKTLGYIPLLVAQAIVGELNESLGYSTPKSLCWLPAGFRRAQRRAAARPARSHTSVSCTAGEMTASTN